MKMIRSIWEDVLTIFCQCCPDEYMVLQRYKDYSKDISKKQNWAYLYEFKADYKIDFKRRFQKFIKTMINPDHFKTGLDQIDNGFPISHSQMWEFYSTLYTDALESGIIDQNDHITNDKDFKTTIFHDDNIPTGNFTVELFYKSKEGLVLFVDRFMDKDVNEYYDSDFWISWSPVEVINKDLKKSAWKNILNPNYKYNIQEYSGILYKEDVIELLHRLNVLLSEDGTKES